MTVEQLMQVVHAQPFQPFRLNMADGRPCGDRAMKSGCRTVIVFKPDELFEVVDLLLVASSQILNGKRRPRKTG